MLTPLRLRDIGQRGRKTQAETEGAMISETFPGNQRSFGEGRSM